MLEPDQRPEQAGNGAALMRLWTSRKTPSHGSASWSRCEGTIRTSSKGMVKALRQLGDLQAIGTGEVDLSLIRPRRLMR